MSDDRTPVRPSRANLLPYGRQTIEEDDLGAVHVVLRSDWLTTGPKVAEFERLVADHVGVREAVAVSSGTAALHAAMHALGLTAGDEVIVPAITFAATANAAVYVGARPVFADVLRDNLLIDPRSVAERITPRTRAIVAVDYAGHPCDYDALQALAARHRLPLVVDACHALGGAYRGRPVGSFGVMNVFSFHPVKHITTAEGGMVTTDDPALAERMRRFRNHGIATDHRQREKTGSWFYEMTELGFNYRLSDLQCALGISQFRKLSGWIERRREIARMYDEAFAGLPAVRPLQTAPDVGHAYHLYVVRVSDDRARVFADLRREKIGVNVHYVPVHLHPYYQQQFGTGRGLCPVAEHAYEEIISLPMFAGMSAGDVHDVVAAVRHVVNDGPDRAAAA